MFRAIVRTALVILLLSWALPTVNVSNWVTLVITSLVLSFLYGIVRPVLKVFFLPINIITLGLFTSVLNALLLWLATYLVPGFEITPMVIFGVYLNQFFSLILISVCIGFLHSLLKFLI